MRYITRERLHTVKRISRHVAIIMRRLQSRINISRASGTSLRARCMRAAVTTHVVSFVHTRPVHSYAQHQHAGRRLPSAVRSATPAFHVRSSSVLCPGRLERVTRLPARSACSVGSFRRNLETFLLSFYYSVHSALQAL